MKKVSTAALVLAMLSGASIIGTPSALAAKKETAPAGPTVSKEFGAQLEKAKAAFAANDDATAETAVVAAEALAKSDDEKYYAALIRYQLLANRAKAQAAAANGAYDAAPLAAPLDVILASPRLPADQVAGFAFDRGRIAFRAKQYPQAIAYLTRAQTAGSTEPNLLLLLSESKIQTGDVAGAMALLDAYYASGKPMTDDQFRYAVAHANDAKLRADTIKWLQRWVAAMPTARTWHDALAFYGYSQKPIATLDKMQLIDLFRLMRQTKALADQNSYEAFAQRLSTSGLPEETKAVVDEGRANGKLPAGSLAIAYGTNAASQLSSPASLTTLATRAGTATDGKLSQQTADVYLGRGDYAKAVTLYRQALAKGGVNAEQVNTDLGIALALSGDKVAAKEAFAQVKTAPRSEIAAFWTTWLDHPVAG